jgi:hypothetical protein
MSLAKAQSVSAGFNSSAALPYNLRLKDFELAMQDVYDFFFDVNTLLLGRNLERLDDMLRPAIMSGLMTLTSGNSWCAFFGRSPPRSVITQPNNFAASLQPGIGQGRRNPVRDQRIGGHYHMRPRNQRGQTGLGPIEKETINRLNILIVQYRKPRKGRSGVPVERRRNSPNAPLSLAHFLLLASCDRM